MPLKTSELLFRKMFDEIEDYAIVSLDTDGYIVNWNRGASLIKGYAEQEIVGKHFSIFYTPNDVSIKKPEQLFALAIREGKAKAEGWRVRKDGTRFWGSIVITAIHGDDGEFIGFTKLTRDLTEKKLAELASLKRLGELDLMNRDLEQFIYIASHDLQEPLLTISNFIELIRSECTNELEKNSQAVMYLDYIANASMQLRELIKGLLDYSRIGKQRRESEVDFNLLLHTVEKEMEATIAATGATIRYHSLPAGKAFETELLQLFQNLLSNAIKFRKKEIPPVVNITAEPEGWRWKFTVSDNGIGIDDRYKEKIFRIFQRLHNRNVYEGNGIGLAHCKKIVEMHKGAISVESELGKGSTFYFTLNI